MTDSAPESAPVPPPRTVRLHRWIALLLALWIVSLVITGWGAVHWFLPQQVELQRENAGLRHRLGQIDALQQQVANLKNSDAITRAANQDLQTTLSGRDEEVSALRADVAFYERLVGAGGQRHGLSVHSVKFAKDINGSWHFTATLTQNLNRGKITEGDMSLRIDGARGGKLLTLQWADLLQKPQPPGQPFQFRYFQKEEGTVMLPAGFTPHQVTVILHSDGRTIQQAFSWAEAMDGEPADPADGS